MDIPKSRGDLFARGFLQDTTFVRTREATFLYTKQSGTSNGHNIVPLFRGQPKGSSPEANANPLLAIRAKAAPVFEVPVPAHMALEARLDSSPEPRREAEAALGKLEAVGAVGAEVLHWRFRPLEKNITCFQ